MLAAVSNTKLIGRDIHEKNRPATSLELFYDLIFVVAIASLCLLNPALAASDGKEATDITQRFMSARISYTNPLALEQQNVTADKILAGKLDSLFFHPPETAGWLDREALWYSTDLPVDMLSGNRYMLELPYVLSRVSLWYKTANDEVLPIQASTGTTPVFFLPDSGGKDLQLLINIAGNTPAIFKAVLWPEETWSEHQQRLVLWQGLIIGVLVALMLYSVSLFIITRESSYIYYLVHLFFLSLLLIDIAGLRQIYTNLPGLSVTYLAMATAAGVMFCNRFLKLRTLSLPAWWLGIFISIATVFLGVLNLSPAQIIPDKYIFLGIIGLSGIAVAFYLALSIFVYVKADKTARFLIPAFTALAVVFCVYIYSLSRGELPATPIHLIVEFVVLLEAFLISLALADRNRLSNFSRNYGSSRTIGAQKLFSRQVIHMQETERERFSNTLHDSIGHGLLVLKNNLHALEKNNFDSPDICANIKTLTEQCGNVLADVRDLSHDLHPHTLRKLGLEAAIESTVELAFSQQAIDWVVKTDIDENLLQEEQKIAVYRIIQEAVNNVLRHSEANEVILSVTCDENELSIEIKDDGKGIPDDQTIEEGIGFSTMSGRAELLGGWMKVISSETQGTILKFGIPLK